MENITRENEFLTEKEKLAIRWNHLLRNKASEYEHTARKRGETVSSPSIDDICNEMSAFFTGFIK